MTGQSLSAIKYSDACSVRSLCDSYARAYVKLSRRFSLTSSWPCLDRKERERKTFFISCGGQRKSIDYGIVSCDSQLIASARQKRKLIIFSWRELSLCSRSVSPIQLPQPWTSNCNSCTFEKAHKIPASSVHLWEMVPHKSGAKANINSPRFCFSLLNDLFDRCQIVARTFPRIFRLRETSCFPPLPPRGVSTPKKASGPEVCLSNERKFMRKLRWRDCRVRDTVPGRLEWKRLVLFLEKKKLIETRRREQNSTKIDS